MIFHPQQTSLKTGRYVISGNVQAVAHRSLCNATLREFWNNFTFGCSSLSVEKTDSLTFSVGSASALPLNGYAFSLNIDTDGICLCAENEAALRDGFMVLLDRIRAIDTENDAIAACADACVIRDRAWTALRMVHFCIFPETELWELQRFVRFCGALNYTHIILEFWGMLRYDCLKELCWPHGFTKEQVRPIIREAHELGMEVIPMFNHWGHATAGRVMHGKHVVLDQNPTLQTYFTDDGWCWDIRKEKVKALLRSIRKELLELCGEGKYFHIGCDEAYGFALTEENMTFLCDFINGVADELETDGRRAIMWGDMILYRHDDWNPDNRYSCHAPAPNVETFMLPRLDRKIIMADWQYHAQYFPIETSEVFTKAGFDCLLCPWDEGRAQMNAAVATVKEQKLMGMMHTTWHTLSAGMAYVLLAAVGDTVAEDSLFFQHVRTNAASLLRKSAPVNGDYHRAGWSKKEIDCKW